MGHCQGGAGAADHFDLLTPLIEWVEAGVAPQAVIGVKRAADGSAAFSRRLCPYPQAARYAGGDARDAASYVCTAPPPAQAAGATTRKRAE
jgi:feruloyl esterase